MEPGARIAPRRDAAGGPWRTPKGWGIAERAAALPTPGFARWGRLRASWNATGHASMKRRSTGRGRAHNKRYEQAGNAGAVYVVIMQALCDVHPSVAPFAARQSRRERMAGTPARHTCPRSTSISGGHAFPAKRRRGPNGASAGIPCRLPRPVRSRAARASRPAHARSARSGRSPTPPPTRLPSGRPAGVQPDGSSGPDLRPRGHGRGSEW